jgi:predicted permease
MSVPLWASLVSLIVAAIPSFQHWLQFHALPVTGAISSAGNCSIPMTLVVLGAYFYPNPPESVNDPSNVPNMLVTNQPKSTSLSDVIGAIRGFIVRRFRREDHAVVKQQLRKGETKTVTIAILARMIITPVLLMPLIILSAKYDFHPVFEE